MILPPLRPYPPILGLAGPAGSGKTTLADAIAVAVKGRRLSFAAPIRDMLESLGVSYELLVRDKLKPIEWLGNKTARQLLRSLGTDWGRDLVHPDIWVNAVLRIAAESKQPMVIDDVRFDNEAEALKHAGAVLYLVYNPNVVYTHAHATECGLKDWGLLDGVIDQLEDGYDDDHVYLMHQLDSRHTHYMRRRGWLERLTGMPRQHHGFKFDLAPVASVAKSAALHWRRRAGRADF